MEYIVSINNGVGTKEFVEGNYLVSASVLGYDSTTLNPSRITISSDTSSFDFNLAATGKLILHVSETGEDSGSPVADAIFYRCDSLGNVYGDAITTDSVGSATFLHVPYASSNAPYVYFKQVSGDLGHTFNKEVQKIMLTSEETTMEIQNAKAPERTFKLTDANYLGLPIESGEIVLKEVV